MAQFFNTTPDMSFPEIITQLRQLGVATADLPATEEEWVSLQEDHTNKFESWEEMMAQLATLYELSQSEEVGSLGGRPLTEAEAEHVFLLTLQKIIMTKTPRTPGPKIAKFGKNWQQKFISKLTEVAPFIPGPQIAFFKGFLVWLSDRAAAISHYTIHLGRILMFTAEVLFSVSKQGFNLLTEAFTIWADSVLGARSINSRIKSAWALTGSKDPYMSARRALEEAIAFTHYAGRKDALTDFQDMVNDIETVALKHGIDVELFHTQFRQIRFGRPVLTQEQADLMGFEHGSYVVDETFQHRVQDIYRPSGVPVGADMVYKTQDPAYIQQSVSRYSPKYEELTPEDRNMANQVVDALVKEYPSVYLNSRISTPAEVKNYVKQKYAPGSPFIGKFKSRQALFDAGFDDVLVDLMVQKLRRGEFPVIFNKAFIKSQIVNAEAVQHENKNVRTVIAEELLTYWILMCLRLETNKRIDWRLTGSGMGMVLNQNMEYLYKELIKVKQDGGRFAIADAHEYDSRVKPFGFEIASGLARKGFEGHPTGKGDQFSSAVVAGYDAIQDCYIIRETERDVNDCISIVAPSEEVKAIMLRLPHRFVSGEQILADNPEYDWHTSRLNEEHPIHKAYRGKVVVWSNDPTVHDETGRSFQPLASPLHMFLYVNYHLDRVHNNLSFDSSEAVVKYAIDLHQNRRVLYNFSDKNRGGSTGFYATSTFNKDSFKGSFVAGWCRAHDYKKTPADFFTEGNKLFNTGDDSAIALKIARSGIPKDKWIESMAYYGLDLDFDFVDRIEQVDYLGKGVRKPSAEDRKVLDRWQQMTIERKLQSARARHQDVQELDFYKPAHPDYLVIQRERELFLRRSAFRYYQADSRNMQFLHTSIQRSVGHMALCAFNATLYRRIANEYCEDALRLAHFYGVEGCTFSVKNDKWGLPCVSISNPDTRVIQEGSRQYQFREFLRRSPAPSFAKIVYDNMKPEEISGPEKTAVFMRRLTRKSAPPDEFLRIFVDYAHDWISDMPRAYYKMVPNYLQMYPEDAFKTKTDYVGIWTYLSFKDQIRTRADFTTLLDQGPYGAVSNREVTFDAMQDPITADPILKHPTWVYGNMVCLMTILYFLWYPLEQLIRPIWFLGVFIQIVRFSLIDIPKLYSQLNLAYYHGKARSSAEISAIMPKDAYIWVKRLVGYTVGLLPAEVGYVLRFDLVVWVAPWIVESIASTISRWRRISSGERNRESDFANPWLPLVQSGDHPLRHALEANTEFRGQEVPKPVLLSAETGSGKSSLFPDALKQCFGELPVTTWRYTILCMPNRTLVNEWNSPFYHEPSDSPPTLVQILSKGKELKSEEIFLGTQGHILQRLGGGQFQPDQCLLLVDEAHMLNGEMLALIDMALSLKFKIICMSATPLPLPIIPYTFIDAGFKKRFSKEVHIRDDTPLNNYMWARANFPEQANKAIIVVNRPQEVAELADALSYNNIRCHQLTSATSAEKINPDTQVIIATQIIAVGVSIPGRRLLVANGKWLSNNEGEKWFENTSEAYQKQIDDRVGRYCEGDIVIKPSWAGTGGTPKPYPSPSYFSFELVSLYFDLPRLTSCSLTDLPDTYRIDKDLPYVALLRGAFSNLEIRQACFIILVILASADQATMAKNCNDILKGRGEEHFSVAERYALTHTLDLFDFNAIANKLRVPDNAIWCFTKTSESQLNTRIPLSHLIYPTIELREAPWNVGQIRYVTGGIPIPHKKTWRTIRPTAEIEIVHRNSLFDDLNAITSNTLPPTPERQEQITERQRRQRERESRFRRNPFA